MPDNNGLDNSDVSTLINFFQRNSGFQLSNRFKINITPPSGLGITPPPMFATLVQIPGQNIQYYSDTVAPSESVIDMPLKREYDRRFIVDFIIDKNWNVRQFFERWINYIFINSNGSSDRTAPSTIVRLYEDIVGSMVINPLDVNSNKNKTITMYKIWPALILPTQMMNDTPNQYLTLTIDMNYRYYVIS